MGPPKKDPMQWPKPLAVMTLIGFIYFVFLYNNILPQIQRLTFKGEPGVIGARHTLQFLVRPAELEEVVAVSIVFHVCFLFLIIAFVRSVLTPPGTVPKTDKWRWNGVDIEEREGPLLRRLKEILAFPIRVSESNESKRTFMKTVAIADRKKNLEKRVCDKCNVFKPDRCHHCKSCGTCVLRMDHHCPFISNCVGFNNHKYFLQLLFYALVCLLFVLVDMFPRFLHVFRPMLDWEYFFKMDLPVGFAYVLTLVVFLGLFAFFSFHVYLLTSCVTTIEQMEKRQSQEEDRKHRWKMVHLKYGSGFYGNITHVLGSPWMWLLPIAPRSIKVDDGTYTNIDIVDMDPENLKMSAPQQTPLKKPL